MVTSKGKKFIDTHPYIVQYSNLPYWWLTKKLSGIIVKFRVTPNQITLAGFILAMLAMLFFGIGEWRYLFAGLVCIHMSILFDFLDGLIAKEKSLTSVYGAWLDSVVDRFVDPLLFIAISIGLYRMKPEPLIWVFCAFAVSGRLLVDTIFFITKLELPDGSSELERELKTKGRFVRLFLYGRTNIHFLTTIFVIVNAMKLYLLVIALYSYLFYLFSFLYLNKKIRSTQFDQQNPIIKG